jgi:hypothetical protein
MKFKCLSCHHVFTSKGERKEYHDAIFGPCSKIVATCPQCNEEAVQYQRPKPSKVVTEPFSGGCGSANCCMK